jgi:hypothetical protein
LDAEPIRLCTPKSLPLSLAEAAARIAITLNPANAPLMTPYYLAAAAAPLLSPAHLALLTTAYWGPQGVHLTVGFLEPCPADLAAEILSHFNAWSKTANVQFSLTNTDPMVRITREGDGYWSYLGTGILSIPRDQPTMCLQAATRSWPESEKKRVWRHEPGHTVGFDHEHMRPEIVALIDPQKAIRKFGGPPNNWPPRMVQEQILTPRARSQLRGGPPNPKSIMCYHIDGDCTYSGQPIPGGEDIDADDYQVVASLYPKSDAPGGSKPLSPDEIYKRIAGAF